MCLSRAFASSCVRCCVLPVGHIRIPSRFFPAALPAPSPGSPSCLFPAVPVWVVDKSSRTIVSEWKDLVSPSCVSVMRLPVCIRLSVSVMCVRLCAFTSLSRSRVRLCLRSPLRLWRSVYSLHPCSLPPCHALWPLSGLFAFGPFRLGLFASGPVSGVLFCSPLALRLRSAALRSSPPPLLFRPCHRSSSPPLSPLPRYPTVSDVVLDLGIWELVFRTGFWTSFWAFFIFILCNITGFFLVSWLGGPRLMRRGVM